MEPGVVFGGSVLVVFVLLWAGSFVLGGPIGKAIAQRIAGDRTDPLAVADLEARVQALEAGRPITGETDLIYQRMAELEERLDFAERLLSQGREPARIEEGK